MAEELPGLVQVDAEGADSEVTPRGRSSIRSRLFLLVKFAVTAGLCAWIVSFVDWHLFWDTLRGSKLWVIGIVVLLRIGGIVISSEKWRQLLTIHGLFYTFNDLVRWYFVALFLNHFLPSNIGGDSYRLYKTWNNQRGRAYAVFAVFIERLSGVVVLALFGYVAALIIYVRTRDSVAASLIVILTAGGTAGILGWVVLQRFQLLQKLARVKFFPQAILRLGDFSQDYQHQPRRTLVVIVLSFLFHANKLFAIWLLLYALGTTTNFLELATVIVAVDVIGLLPISIGGLGVVEGSFIYMIGHYGVGQEMALATMLLLRALLIPLSMVGAYFYFVGDRSGRRIVPAEVEHSGGNNGHVYQFPPRVLEE